MKKLNFLLILTLFVSSIYAREGKDISLKSSYVLPIENSDFNSSLVLGIGSDFWGIFEFIGNVYLDIKPNEVEFINKFNKPNIFSLGVGMNIPMGGFYMKSDYQRFFNVTSETNELSISNYTDSYMFGIGISLTRDVELDCYYRTLLNSESFPFYKENQRLIGIGFSFIL